MQVAFWLLLFHLGVFVPVVLAYSEGECDAIKDPDERVNCLLKGKTVCSGPATRSPRS